MSPSSSADTSSRPFAGIEVVEFGQFIAVPFCAQLLAEGGARVTKIEALEGDPVRQLSPLAPGETRHFLSRNRGKRSLPLDLRHPRAQEVIERLLARADVILTNFRPGLAEEFGLDWTSLAPRFPRLIVGSVSAFGRRGPDARLAGMDLVVQARTGLMASLGRVEDGVPATGEAPVADYVCALSLAFGIASALLRRERTGRGGEVEAALMMAALVAQNNSMVRVESVDGAEHAKVRARLAAMRAAGRPFTEQDEIVPSARTPGMVNVYYRTYATKDDVVGVACVSPGLQRAFMEVLGLVDDAPRGADRAALERHYTGLAERCEQVLASRTAAAAIRRSAGSPGNGSGNWAASVAIAGVISLTTTPLRASNSASHASGIPFGTSRPRVTITANSQTVTDAIAMPPEPRAARMALVAAGESCLGVNMSHAKVCVSSTITAALSRRAPGRPAIRHLRRPSRCRPCTRRCRRRARRQGRSSRPGVLSW